MPTRRTGHRLALPCLMAVLGCAAPQPVPPGPPPRLPMAVSPHPLVGPVAAEEVDAMLRDTSTVLAAGHAEGDATCPLRIERDRPVRPLDRRLPSEVNSREDFEALVSVPGRIAVVQEIRWCGGLRADGILGCAAVSGRSLVMRRHDRGREGQTLAHTLGHGSGPSRRDPRSLPAPRAGGTPARLPDPQACATPAGPAPGAELAAAPRARSPPHAQAARGAAGTVDAAEFARRAWPHGFPLSAARRFAEEEVRRVLPMLDEDSERPAWANLVLLAGAAGGPETTGRLVAFLRRPRRDPADPAAVMAMTSVPVALGYLCGRRDDPAALAILARGTRQDYWRPAFGWARTPDELEGLLRLMANQSVVGLGLSGRPSAEAQLRRLLPEAAAPRTVAAAEDPAPARRHRLIEHSIETARAVRTGGLAAVRP